MRGILGFHLKDKEFLYEAWERFKELLLLCPHHGQPRWTLIHVFYNAVETTMRMMIDTSVERKIMNLGVDDAWENHRVNCATSTLLC